MAGRIGLHRKVVALGGAVALWVAIACLGSVAGVVSPLVGLFLVLVVLVPYVIVLGACRRARSGAIAVGMVGLAGFARSMRRS